jgi:hypothetical protein
VTPPCDIQLVLERGCRRQRQNRCMPRSACDDAGGLCVYVEVRLVGRLQMAALTARQGGCVAHTAAWWHAAYT